MFEPALKKNAPSFRPKEKALKRQQSSFKSGKNKNQFAEVLELNAKLLESVTKMNARIIKLEHQQKDSHRKEMKELEKKVTETVRKELSGILQETLRKEIAVEVISETKKIVTDIKKDAFSRLKTLVVQEVSSLMKDKSEEITKSCIVEQR